MDALGRAGRIERLTIQPPGKPMNAIAEAIADRQSEIERLQAAIPDTSPQHKKALKAQLQALRKGYVASLGRSTSPQPPAAPPAAAPPAPPSTPNTRRAA